MIKIILLLGVLVGCRELNKQANTEISRFMIRNSRTTCISIEKDDSDEAYIVERMIIVCGKRYIDEI